MTRYDAQDVDAAMDELDARWTATGGDTGLATWAADLRGGLAFGDVSRLREVATGDFVLVDHQHVGFGELDIDEWMATMEPLLDDPPVRWTLGQIVGDRRPTWLLGYRMTNRDSSWDRWLVIVTRGNRASRAEMFDATQHTEARARFDELTAPPDG